MKIILRVIFYIIKAIKFCKNLKIIIVSIQKFYNFLYLIFNNLSHLNNIFYKFIICMYNVHYIVSYLHCIMPCAGWSGLPVYTIQPSTTVAPAPAPATSHLPVIGGAGRPSATTNRHPATTLETTTAACRAAPTPRTQSGRRRSRHRRPPSRSSMPSSPPSPRPCSGCSASPRPTGSHHGKTPAPTRGSSTWGSGPSASTGA